MNILIIGAASLSNAVRIMIVVSELRKQMPKCVIDWVVDELFLDVASQSKIARNVFADRHFGSVLSIFRIVSKIKQQAYDYVFDMQGTAHSGIITFFARAPHKVGREDTSMRSRLTYTEVVHYPGQIHIVDILKEFIDHIGGYGNVSGTIKELKNIISPTYLKFIKEELDCKPAICLFPESRIKKKEWKFFPELAQKLLSKPENFYILLLGERKFPDFKISNPRFFDLRGKTNLADIVFLTRVARLTIANDTGPLHISAAQGRPTLGLFTATDPSRSGPYPLQRETNVALRLNNRPQEIDFVAQTATEMFRNFSTIAPIQNL